jgi:two-component system response regulator FlrC
MSTAPSVYAKEEAHDDVDITDDSDFSNAGFKSELKDKENQLILDMLNACNGKRKDVAEKLGISPRTLRYKLARMRDDGIQLPA